MYIRILSTLSLLIALAALVRSILEQRSHSRFRLLDLIRDRFSASPVMDTSTPTVMSLAVAYLLAVLAGAGSVVISFGLFLALGWAQVEPVAVFSASLLSLVLLTLLIKLVWAAIEELFYRRAVLPQLTRCLAPAVALLVSAVLFALGHYGSRDFHIGGWFSLAVFTLDGVGFGIAYLATGSLSVPTLWHLSKNLAIWLLFSKGTLQFAPGLFRTRYIGPSFWAGAAQQAGMVDLLVTFGVVVLAFLVSGGCRLFNTAGRE